MEKQNLGVMERDRTWRDWQARFEQVESQSLNLDSQLQSLDATHRAVKRSQETFDEISARFERRINEITEMQRLIEERFRQEWVSFKADDQKRWTNYTLAQEEQNRELNRQFGKSEERVVLSGRPDAGNSRFIASDDRRDPKTPKCLTGDGAGLGRTARPNLASQPLAINDACHWHRWSCGSR